MERKLYRSSDNKVIAGVCGGIGEYFNVDPVIIRLIAVIFTLMGGSGLIAYIIAAFIIPARNSIEYFDTNKDSKKEGPEVYKKGNKNTAIVLGIILIAAGGMVFFRHFVHWIPSTLMFAAVLVIVGVFLIFKRL